MSLFGINDRKKKGPLFLTFDRNMKLEDQQIII